MAERRGQTPFRLSDAEASALQSTDARLEQQIIESYLARIEQSLEAHVDEQVEKGLQGVRRGQHNPAATFTGRIAASLGLGIPLTAVAGGIGNSFGHGGGVACVIAVLVTIGVLNIYYTEVEKDLEKERIRRGRQ